MPFLNEIFTKKELEELLENEVFQKMIGSKENPLNRPELLESENWFCIHGKFISKNMTIIGRAWVAASLNNRDITPVKIFYMTGEFLEVKTGHSWNVSTIQSFNYLLWNEYKIIPVMNSSSGYSRSSFGNLNLSSFEFTRLFYCWIKTEISEKLLGF